MELIEIIKNNKDFRIEHDIPEYGYKFHMNDINATIGLSNLPFVEENIQHARNIAVIYDKELSNLNSIKISKRNINSNSSFWLYTLFVNDKENFVKWMNECNIMASQVHQRNDVHSCVSQFKNKLNNLDLLADKICCIPIGWWVSKYDALYIVKCIKEFDNCKIGKIRKLDLKDKDVYCHLILTNLKMNAQISDWEWEKYLNTNKNKIYVIVDDNLNVVGTCKIEIETKLLNPVGHIEDVVVNEEYRNKGYGRRMISYLCDLGKESNCYKIVLNCKENNDKFYEKCLFVKEGSEMVLRFFIIR